MTWNFGSEQQIGHYRNTVTVPNVPTTCAESNVVDLFTIGASGDTERKFETKPFIHQVQFKGPQGEVVRAWANIDDGAMKEVMLSETFRKVKHWLGPALPSSQLLRVANGVII